MVTIAASIVTNPALVTTVMHLVHTVEVHLPAITVGLRAVGAVLGVVAGVRAVLRSHQRDHD
jgi:hypothetical protein